MLRPGRLVTLCILVVSFWFLNVTARSQRAASSNPDGPCVLPALSPVGQGANMFSDELEEWLGDVIDQTFRKQFHVVEDSDGYLQRLSSEAG
jgi:hypothetical protein